MEKKEERKQEKALRKKAYEKPCIVYQQSLEARADVCGTGVYPYKADASCVETVS